MAEAQPYTCETVEIASAALGLSRRITVCIPKPARQAARNPVLYLNDGQNLFDSARSYTGVTWRVAETASWLIERGVIPPIVIVGIDHGELRRGREYLPVEDERNPFAREPLAAEYAAFVTDELMPAIEREFPVGRGATYAAFGGSSYGAIATLFTAMSHPGTFGRLLLESPSLYVAQGALLRLARKVQRGRDGSTSVSGRLRRGAMTGTRRPSPTCAHWRRSQARGARGEAVEGERRGWRVTLRGGLGGTIRPGPRIPVQRAAAG